jgi:hypothetical protein
MRLLLGAAVVLLLSVGSLSAATPDPGEGFVSLFDGKTLGGWKVGEGAELFQVRDGMIVMECPETHRKTAHIFYDGDVAHHEFKNFDLKVDVMTFPKANSGIFFHTKYVDSGRLSGIECQIDNSHSDWRRTGSLWGIKNISWGPETPPQNNKEEVAILPQAPVTDNAWYTQEIVCQNGVVVVKLNGKTVLEYKVDDADREHTLLGKRMWSPRGTFALQGHPPMPGAISKVYFKNIRVKILPD